MFFIVNETIQHYLLLEPGSANGIYNTISYSSFHHLSQIRSVSAIGLSAIGPVSAIDPVSAIGKCHRSQQFFELYFELEVLYAMN